MTTLETRKNVTYYFNKPNPIETISAVNLLFFIKAFNCFFHVITTPLWTHGPLEPSSNAGQRYVLICSDSWLEVWKRMWTSFLKIRCSYSSTYGGACEKQKNKKLLHYGNRIVTLIKLMAKFFVIKQYFNYKPSFVLTDRWQTKTGNQQAS